MGNIFQYIGLLICPGHRDIPKCKNRKIRRNLGYQKQEPDEDEEEVVVIGAGKATDAMESMALEEVSVVEEDVVEICITPTTPGMVLTSEIFLEISVVPIGMPFKGSGLSYVSHQCSREKSFDGHINDGACRGRGCGVG